MLTARALVGTKELPGPANSPKIMGWGNALGARILGIAYTADSVPWCGLFAAWCMHKAGHAPPKIAIRAKAWATWGREVKSPIVGAVAVFDRQGGGHVGFVAGSYPNGDLAILGGNQGDAVNVRRFPRDRLMTLRWPAGVPVVSLVLTLTDAGVKTTGEA